MTRLILTVILFLITPLSYSQQNVLVFKKKNKPIEQFWIGSIIAFQLKDKEWQKGEITKVQNDSFYIRPFIVHYTLMGTDTVRFNVAGFSFSDIYAMPKRGVLIHYANGHFEINKSAGHMHFYWIKSGFVFRLGAATYAALHLINGMIKNNLSLSESIKPLGIAAAVFAGGVILQKSYKVTHRLKRKYHFEILKLS